MLPVIIRLRVDFRLTVPLNCLELAHKPAHRNLGMDVGER